MENIGFRGVVLGTEAVIGGIKKYPRQMNLALDFDFDAS